VFATTSALFGTRGFWGADWLAALAGEIATVGALADVRENIYALHLLKHDHDPEATLASAVRTMRASSLAKWATIFTATAILSVMFYERGGLNIAVALIYTLAAALGLTAIAAEAFKLPLPGRRVEQMLRTAFYTNGVALTLGLAIAASQT
jgi:hypothetical protein